MALNNLRMSFLRSLFFLPKSCENGGKIQFYRGFSQEGSTWDFPPDSLQSKGKFNKAVKIPAEKEAMQNSSENTRKGRCNDVPPISSLPTITRLQQWQRVHMLGQSS